MNSRERREQGHPSSLQLEQLAFDPPGLPENADAAAHAKRCAQCAQRVASLKQGQAAFLIQKPAPAFMEKLERPRWRLRWPVLALAATAALALLLVMRVGPNPPREPSVKFKGQAQLALRLHVSRGGGPARPFDVRAPLFPQDVVRFVVDLPERGHVSVLSVDGESKLSWYYPPNKTATAPLTQGRGHALPGAIALDDYVGQELLVLLLTQEPVRASEIEAHVQKTLQAAQNNLEVAHQRGFGAGATSVLIHKRAP